MATAEMTGIIGKRLLPEVSAKVLEQQLVFQFVIEQLFMLPRSICALPVVIPLYWILSLVLLQNLMLMEFMPFVNPGGKADLPGKVPTSPVVFHWVNPSNIPLLLFKIPDMKKLGPWWANKLSAVPRLKLIPVEKIDPADAVKGPELVMLKILTAVPACILETAVHVMVVSAVCSAVPFHPLSVNIICVPAAISFNTQMRNHLLCHQNYIR